MLDSMSFIFGETLGLRVCICPGDFDWNASSDVRGSLVPSDPISIRACRLFFSRKTIYAFLGFAKLACAKSAGGSVPFPPSPWKGCSLARAPPRVPVRNKIRKSVLSSFGAERRRSCVCRSVARARSRFDQTFASLRVIKLLCKVNFLCGAPAGKHTHSRKSAPFLFQTALCMISVLNRFHSPPINQCPTRFLPDHSITVTVLLPYLPLYRCTKFFLYCFYID